MSKYIHNSYGSLLTPIMSIALANVMPLISSGSFTRGAVTGANVGCIGGGWIYSSSLLA